MLMSAIYFEMHQNIRRLDGWIDEYIWMDINKHILYMSITIVNILLYLHYHIFYIYVIYKKIHIVKSIHCKI